MISAVSPIAAVAGVAPFPRFPHLDANCGRSGCAASFFSVGGSNASNPASMCWMGTRYLSLSPFWCRGWCPVSKAICALTPPSAWRMLPTRTTLPHPTPPFRIHPEKPVAVRTRSQKLVSTRYGSTPRASQYVFHLPQCFFLVSVVESTRPLWIAASPTLKSLSK